MAFQKKKLYPYLTPAAILMAGALIAGSLLYNQFSSGGNQGSAGARIGGAVTGDQGQDQEPSGAPPTDGYEREGPQLCIFRTRIYRCWNGGVLRRGSGQVLGIS